MTKILRQHQSAAVFSMDGMDKGIVHLPTGTGKTLVISRSIIAEINKSKDPKVYVILSPRILLSNQLMDDVFEDLLGTGTDVHRLVIHSGQLGSDRNNLEDELDLQYKRDCISTTSPKEIKEEFNKSKREKVPLLISCTYHSAERLRDSKIPIEIIYFDEGHYLTREDFSWIVQNTPAKRSFSFTATLRHTPSDEGTGMNNSELFGEVLYQESPHDMILAGEIIRPRIHIVELSENPDQDEGDGIAVAEAFRQHSSEVNVGAKMLVVSKDGSEHLNALVSHPAIKQLKRVRTSLIVFDISSKYGARIDGLSVSRTEFLERLRGLEDRHEALIIHHDILTEGIDVAGITGVMPFTFLGMAKFLQLLGRATRLHPQDRKSLYAEELEAEDLAEFVKPYAWVIIPAFGSLGDDLREQLKNLVFAIRSYGFNPSEDIMIRPTRGKKEVVSIDTVSTPTKMNVGIAKFATEVIHEIESEEHARYLELEDAARFDNITDEMMEKHLAEFDPKRKVEPEDFAEYLKLSLIHI